MKLNKKIFVILVSLLFTFLCGCTQNTQSEPTEQPHLYWKDIDVVVENVDSRHWFASTHHYWVMDSTGEIVRQEIHKVY